MSCKLTLMVYDLKLIYSQLLSVTHTYSCLSAVLYFWLSSIFRQQEIGLFHNWSYFSLSPYGRTLRHCSVASLKRLLYCAVKCYVRYCTALYCTLCYRTLLHCTGQYTSPLHHLLSFMFTYTSYWHYFNQSFNENFFILFCFKLFPLF